MRRSSLSHLQCLEQRVLGLVGVVGGSVVVVGGALVADEGVDAQPQLEFAEVAAAAASLSLICSRHFILPHVEGGPCRGTVT